MSLSDEALETAKLLTAGGVAGAVSKSITAPLARLTILYQVQGINAPRIVQGRTRYGVVSAMRHVVAREGLRALWKGNGVTIIHRLPYSSVNFWAYERFSKALVPLLPPDPAYRGTTDVARRLLAGGAAGMCACTLAYPLDLVRTRLAAQTSSTYYKGMTHALQRIVLDEGLGGLYRGLGATLVQVGPSLSINYCTYETLRSHFVARQEDPRSPTVGTSLVCGSVAGLVSSTATFPLDLVRRRMQLVGQHGQTGGMRSSYGAVIREIMAREGLRGMYAGIVPEYLKVIPGVAIAFATYEVMKRLLAVEPVAFVR